MIRTTRRFFGPPLVVGVAIAVLGALPAAALIGDLSQVGPNDVRISHMGPDGHAEFGGSEPDIAYNPDDDEYLVVWSGDHDAGQLVEGESEIWGQLLDGAGSPIGGMIRISDMGNDGVPSLNVGWPAAAYNTAAHEYLVVWSGPDFGPNQTSEDEVWGQRLDTNGAEVGANDFRISDMGPEGGSGTGYLADVAYNPVTDEYLTAFVGRDGTPEYEIYVQRLSGDGTEIGLNDARISTMGGSGDASYHAFGPKVAVDTDLGGYLVVWYGEDNVDGLVDNEWEVFGQRLTSSGQQTGLDDFRISDLGPDGDLDYKAANPAVVYNPVSSEYLVTFSGDDDTDGLVEGEYHIFGQRIGVLGAPVGENDFLISKGSSLLAPRFPASAYGADDGEYVVVWADAVEGNPYKGFEIVAQRVTSKGAPIGPSAWPISDMGPAGDPEFSAIRPAIVFGSGRNEYLVAWIGDDDTGWLVDDEYEVYAQRIGHRSWNDDPWLVDRPSAGREASPRR